MKIAIFGAGKDGIKALQDFGKDNVSFFIDNYKAGDVVNGIPVYSLLQIPQEWKEKLLIFVASDKYKEAMVLQLEENHYINYRIYADGHISGSTRERLSREQWGEMYNETTLENVINHLENGCFNVQTQEILKITHEGEHVLEIGCGTGESSLALSKEGRFVSALDYSVQSIQLVSRLVGPFIWYWLTRWCALPWKRLFLSLSAFLSCCSSLCRLEDTWAFCAPLQYVKCRVLDI